MTRLHGRFIAVLGIVASALLWLTGFFGIWYLVFIWSLAVLFTITQHLQGQFTTMTKVLIWALVIFIGIPALRSAFHAANPTLYDSIAQRFNYTQSGVERMLRPGDFHQSVQYQDWCERLQELRGEKTSELLRGVPATLDAFKEIEPELEANLAATQEAQARCQRLVEKAEQTSAKPSQNWFGGAGSPEISKAVWGWGVVIAFVLILAVLWRGGMINGGVEFVVVVVGLILAFMFLGNFLERNRAQSAQYGQPAGVIPSAIAESFESFPHGSVEDFKVLISRTPRGQRVTYRFTINAGEQIGRFPIYGPMQLQRIENDPESYFKVTMWEGNKIVNDKNGIPVRDREVGQNFKYPPADAIAIRVDRVSRFIITMDMPIS